MSTDEKPTEWSIAPSNMEVNGTKFSIALERVKGNTYTGENCLHVIEHKAYADLESKLDSAHAAILHLRQMSQRVLDSINPGTKNIVSYEALGNLEHALSATSGYKEKAPSK